MNKAMQKIYSEYNQEKNIDYEKLFHSLIDAIQGLKQDQPISDLIDKLTVNHEVTVNQKTEGLDEALAKVGVMLAECQNENRVAMASMISSIKPPSVEVNPSINVESSATSYRFNIKRNSANLMTEVVATPVGER